MITGRYLLIGLLGLVFIMPLSVLAAEMEFHPYVSVKEEYDDNINLTPTDEEEDWVTTLSPGFSLTYDGRSLAATVDYSLEYILYKNNSDDNQDKFSDIQRADANLLFFGGRPFTLTLSEVISREAIDERQVYSADNQRINKTTVYDTGISPQYRWQMTPTLALVLGYDYQRTDYTDSAGDDGQDHSGRLALVKQLSAALKTSANYSYSRHLAELDEDEYDEENITLAFGYTPNARLSLNLEGGLARVKYDLSGEDTDETTWSFDLGYRLTEVFNLTAAYSQGFVTSIANGLTRSREASAGLTWNRELFTLTTELYWDQSDYLAEDREDMAYGWRGSLSHQFSRSLSGSLDGEYEYAEFDDPGPNEEVHHYELGASLAMKIRRIMTTLAYRYRDHGSNRDENDYTNNTVTLTASLRF